MLKKTQINRGSVDKRLENEISILNSINSPFVLQFTGFFDTNEGGLNYRYMIFEFPVVGKLDRLLSIIMSGMK